MLSSFFILANIVWAFADQRDFYPQVPSNSFYHEGRVWIRLDDDCASEEDDARGFKDYLLTQYNCISFDEEKRKTIYKTPIRPHSHAWSLWFEKDDHFIDVECLNTSIQLPSNIPSICIDNVYFEPAVFPHDTFDSDDGCDYQCKKQSVDDTLWSLDILDSKDGSYDNIHTYVLPEDDKYDNGNSESDDNKDGNSDSSDDKTIINVNGDDNSDSGSDDNKDGSSDSSDDGGDDECYVEAIVLDTDVDASHQEFENADPKSLYEGTFERALNPDTGEVYSNEHGTHVSGTILGKTVGGSKNTKLRYFPVCNLWSWWSKYNRYGEFCAWSDIEAGYNTAISYMEEQRKQKKENIRFVINYSVGGGRGDNKDLQYEEWGQKIQDQGGIWVTSAGNDKRDACDASPAFTPKALTIGAYDKELKPAWFTNYGSCVDAWGPGLDIYSAKAGGGYRLMSGTSMASPNIASMAVNLLKMNIKMTFDDIKQYMKDNARHVDGDWAGEMNQPYLICDDGDNTDNGNNGNNGNDGDNTSVQSQPMLNEGVSHDNLRENSNDNKDNIIIICCVVFVILLANAIHCFRKRSSKKSKTKHGFEASHSEESVDIDTIN